MVFSETTVKGAYVIDIEKRRDDRGFFARAWCKKEFEERGLNSAPVQMNIAYSRNAGTVRGLHYQMPPYGESKLIRCIRGAIYDVIVDLRQDAPSYMRWTGVVLTEDEYKMVYVPEGCAHGYQTLAEDSVVLYQVSQYYKPESERGIRYDDPAFNIKWPIAENLVVSEKDRNIMDYVPGL